MHVSKKPGLSIEVARNLFGSDVRKVSDCDRDILIEMADAENEPNDKLIEAFEAMKELIAE